MRLVAQRLFMQLWHDSGRRYVVTKDQVFHHEIYTDNDIGAVGAMRWSPDTDMVKNW